METERMIAAKKAFGELSLNEQTEFIGDTLEDYFNSFCRERQTELANRIVMKTHPTVLQTEMGFVMKFIEKMATGYHDDRSKASNQLAKRIVDMTNQVDGGYYLPMI